MSENAAIPGPHRAYDQHPHGRGVYWLICIVAFVCGTTACVVSVSVSDGRWVIGGLGVLFILCGLHGLVPSQTIVESDRCVIRRRFRLFGLYTFWSREFPYSDFAAVVLERVRQFEGPDNCFVWLRRRSGRKLLVSYFHGRRPAEELAHTLASDLQITLEER